MYTIRLTERSALSLMHHLDVAGKRYEQHVEDVPDGIGADLLRDLLQQHVDDARFLAGLISQAMVEGDDDSLLD